MPPEPSFPEVVGEDVGQELDREGPALLALSLGLGLDGDRFSMHGSFRAKRSFVPAFLGGPARAGWKPSRLGRRPTPEGLPGRLATPPETMAAERAGRRTGGDRRSLTGSLGKQETWEPSEQVGSIHQRGGALRRLMPGSGSRTEGREGGRSMAEPWSDSGRRGGVEMNAERSSASAPRRAARSAPARRRVRDRRGIPGGRSPRRWNGEPGRRPERRRTRPSRFSRSWRASGDGEEGQIRYVR